MSGNWHSQIQLCNSTELGVIRVDIYCEIHDICTCRFCFYAFQANADLLAHEVSTAVYEKAGGTGDPPNTGEKHVQGTI